MSDDVTLNPGSGGAIIVTEDIGGGIQMPVSKIYTGKHDQNGGPVTVTNPLLTQLGDGPAMSAFSRLKVSQAQGLFLSQQQYGDDNTIWENSFVGTGAVSNLLNESTVQMTTGGAANAASAIRSTQLCFRYQPGHGTLSFQTFVFDTAAISNVRRRIGIFDTGNGIFLEQNGIIDVAIVQRSSTSGSPVDTRVTQANWNVDTFDGSGNAANPSGVLLNLAKANILVMDLQWLGVGRVRFGFDVNGIVYWAHYFENANALTTVYMTTANLPARMEVTNTGAAGGTATLRHICTSIMTGGNEQTYGKYYNVDNGVAGLAITNGATVPIISIRAKTTGPNSVRNTGQILPEQWILSNIGSNNLRWQAVVNATLTGASFAAYNSNHSITEVDTTASAVSGGFVVDAGILSGSAENKGGIAAGLSVADLQQLILRYTALLNVQHALTLVGTASGTGVTAYAGIDWLELWG